MTQLFWPVLRVLKLTVLVQYKPKVRISGTMPSIFSVEPKNMAQPRWTMCAAEKVGLSG